MSINTTYRTNKAEAMDDFLMEGKVLQDALDKIAKINQLLGGNKLTLQGIEKLLKGKDKSKEITIIDIGCGNGDMLRYISEFSKREGYKFKLIGIDANNFTITHARNLSKFYPNINYFTEDIFDITSLNFNYDIVLCTLTLHHFKDNEILELLSNWHKKATIGLIINDLQRSKIAYRLFQALCFVFNLNKMSREDGLISILRGFKKEELIDFSKKLGFKNYSIKWKWAFRYQWIINK
jgi:2-polyprenyl-3-methyl-5-hydroxy-6-metoxy-1,4-benzoquinol methylase